MSGTRIPRWQIGATLGAALVLGVLHGAATALYLSPNRIAPDVAAAPPEAASWEHAGGRDSLRGRFWRPQGSNAERPQPSLRPRSWSPSPLIAAPDELASQSGEPG